MILPNAASAFIDDTKLVEYCLNFEHEEGKHKARVFQSALGITQSNFSVLKIAIIEAIQYENAVLTNEISFGKLYRVDFVMQHQTKNARIRTGWIIKSNEDFPRLITCFVID